MVGVLMVIAGVAVLAVASVWLANNSAFSSDLILTGQQFKSLAAARGGLLLAVLVLVGGLVLIVAGLLTRPRDRSGVGGNAG